MYTPQDNINRSRQLANAMRQTPSGGHWAQALAHAISQGVAGHQDYKANQAQMENDELKKQEMSQLAQIMAQGGQMQGPTQDGSPLTPRFQHPEVQESALAQQMKMQEQAQRASNPTFGNSPIWGKDAEGNWVVMQSSNQGGIQQAPTPEGVQLYPSAGLAGYDPNLIGEREGAETDAEIENIERTAQPAADAAALQATVVGRAETEVDLERQARMYEQERAQEREEARRAAFGRMSSQQDQIANVVAVADKVLSQANVWTTGLIGSMLDWAPGTPQRDLAENLKTLEANAAFDKLQMMRDMSPTGGALGQVSERELDLLKATWSALSQSQSEEQFKENVQRFKDQVQQSWSRVIEAYETDFGEPYYQTAPENSGTLTTEPVEELDILKKADAILGL